MSEHPARTRRATRIYAACPTRECARCIPVGEPCPDCTRNALPAA